MREAFYGRRRFDEFQSALEMPRAVLTARLKRLCDEGMLQRVAYQTVAAALRVPPHRQGPRVLGRAGGDVPLGQRLACGPTATGRPVVLKDRETGAVVRRWWSTRTPASGSTSGTVRVGRPPAPRS